MNLQFQTALLLILFHSFLTAETPGNFIFAGKTSNETRKVNFEKQIQFLEGLMDFSPQLSSHQISLQNTKFGEIIIQIIRSEKQVPAPNVNHAKYSRVLKGQAIFSNVNVQYRLASRDGILIPENSNYLQIKNTDKRYTTILHVCSFAKVDTKKFNVPKVESSPITSEKTKQRDLNVGRLFVLNNQEVNINQIARNLINQNVRLTSQLLAVNSGLSAVMFVLTGTSGCHLHTKSDYMSWNAHNAAHHDMEYPSKFDTSFNDVVLMPWMYKHNLVSHKNSDPNVMVMVQYPPQLTSDSATATGCVQE
jgi:hypothetical protein